MFNQENFIKKIEKVFSISDSGNSRTNNLDWTPHWRTTRISGKILSEFQSISQHGFSWNLK